MIDALIFFSFLLAVGRCLGSVLSGSSNETGSDSLERGSVSLERGSVSLEIESTKRLSSFETLPSASRPQHCPSPPTASFFQSSQQISGSFTGGSLSWKVIVQ